MQDVDDSTIAELSSGGKKKRRSDHAFLLRGWQEEPAQAGQSPRWRFSLEEILEPRQRKGFDSLEALLAFLREEFCRGEGEDQEG